MKNQLLLLAALALSVSVTGQKKELKVAAKALKKGEYSAVWTSLKQVETMYKDMDPKSKSKYLYLKAKASLGAGLDGKNDTKVATSFQELVDFEKTQKKQKYSAEAGVIINKVVQRTAKAGSKSYKEKDYKTASEKFELVYNLSSADTVYLENAALSSYFNKDYDKSIEIYKRLLDMGYTGISTSYKATNIINDEVMYFNNAKDMQRQVAMKIAKDPEVVVSKSRTGDIARNIALSYIAKGDKEAALSAIAEAKKLFPKDYNLVISEANIYFELGDNEKFLAGIKEAISINPTDPYLYYNAGVITMQENYIEEAMDYFNKAVKLKPDYSDAYNNLGACVLEKVTPIIEEMNKSLSDFKKYDKLLLKQKEVYAEALPYYEKAYESNKESKDVLKTLVGLYEVLEMYEKQKEMKAIYDSL
ncbi:tetratricopeptide repeat protein [Bacteroidota bacterium]